MHPSLHGGQWIRSTPMLGFDHHFHCQFQTCAIFCRVFKTYNLHITLIIYLGQVMAWKVSGYLRSPKMILFTRINLSENRHVLPGFMGEKSQDEWNHRIEGWNLGSPHSKTSFAQLPALAVDFLEPTGRVDRKSGNGWGRCYGCHVPFSSMIYHLFELCDCP